MIAESQDVSCKRLSSTVVLQRPVKSMTPTKTLLTTMISGLILVATAPSIMAAPTPQDIGAYHNAILDCADPQLQAQAGSNPYDASFQQTVLQVVEQCAVSVGAYTADEASAIDLDQAQQGLTVTLHLSD